jgi:uncharacterized protein YdhG (YjbR/CyaY superfamily)
MEKSAGISSEDQIKGSNNMKREFKTIDEYVKTFPVDVQRILEKIRETIRKAVPEAEETISYQMPAFKLNGNLVYFAASKNHIGFYPTPSGIESFERELSQYKKGKGTLQFPLDRPIPYDLIQKIVIFRVKENLAKKKQKNLPQKSSNFNSNSDRKNH